MGACVVLQVTGCSRGFTTLPTAVSRRILAKNNSPDKMLTCRVLLNELFIYFNCWILMFAVFF